MTTTADQYQCTLCGGLFAPSGGYNDNGNFICVGCYDRRQLALAAQSAPTRRAPAYDGIVKGAAIISGYANWLLAISILCFMTGTLCIVVPIALFFMKQPVHEPGALIGVGVLLLAAAIFYLVISRLVRMIAELALAHRDIARNSFR